MWRRAKSLRVSLFVVCALLLETSLLHAQCGGTERWAVKVGTDPRAGSIDLDNRIPIALSDLIGQTEPQRPPSGDNTTRLAAETHVYVLRGRLVKFKFETDNDYHMVIADDTLSFTAGGSAPPTGHSFVAEIPDPNCIPGKHGDPSVRSAFITGIQNARAELESQFPNLDKSGAFNDAGGVPVQIVGIGFFDFPHGQVGRAPNNIEVHPVLDIAFNPPLPGGSFTIAASPAQISLPAGGTSSSLITTTMADGLNAAISLSVNGVPPNGSAAFDSPSIPAPGGGSSTLSLTADASTPPGTYSLTVTGSGGGSTQTATIRLTVLAAMPAPPVTLTFPADGATVSGVVNVTATPANSGAVKLEIYVDGALKACNFGANSISYPWDTGTVTNGSHTIFSKGYNGVGSSSMSSTVTVTVVN